MLTANYAIATLAAAKTPIYPIFTYYSFGKVSAVLGQGVLRVSGNAVTGGAWRSCRAMCIRLALGSDYFLERTLRIAGARNPVNYNEKRHIILTQPVHCECWPRPE